MPGFPRLAGGMRVPAVSGFALASGPESRCVISRSRVRARRCQQRSRTVATAFAGLRRHLACCVVVGTYTFADDGHGLSLSCPRHPRPYWSRPIQADVAPWLLGRPGTPRRHPIFAARLGFRRPDKMTAPPGMTWGFTTPGLFRVRFVLMFSPCLLARTDPAIPGLSKKSCECRKPMPPGDIRGSRRQRGRAAGRGSGPGR